MALTRKFLSAMGIAEDQAEQIITAHLETVNPLKQERDDFKIMADQLESVQKDLDRTRKKLQEFEESGNKDSWKVKYDAAVEDKRKIQKDFDDFKADIAARELSAKKKTAYREMLKEAGVSEKRLDSVLKVSDFGSIEFTEDGKIRDVEELVKAIKSEWADFIVTQSEQGANTSNPPQNMGGKTMTREEIMQIRDTSERQRAWAQFLDERKK